MKEGRKSEYPEKTPGDDLQSILAMSDMKEKCMFLLSPDLETEQQMETLFGWLWCTYYFDILKCSDAVGFEVQQVVFMNYDICWIKRLSAARWHTVLTDSSASFITRSQGAFILNT